MRLIIIFFLLLCLLPIPSNALTLFQTNYDSDIYKTEVIYEGEWLPLSNLSEFLSYDVEWNAKTRTITITAARTFKICPDWWIPPGVKIENGTTYVTSGFLCGLLGAEAFIYDGELYVFDGESEQSLLVRGDEDFRQNALTALYRMKLAAPYTYDMIRRNLTGGVESVERPADIPLGALAYVYPSRREPTAYIIGKPEETILARRIVHEAVHVEQYRNGRELDEDEAKKIETETVEKMLSTELLQIG